MNACSPFSFDLFACVGGLIPEWAWWALGAMAVLFVIGVLWRLKDFLALIHRIAGWPGVAGIVGAVAVLVAVIWPKKRDDYPVDLPEADAKPSFRKPKVPVRRTAKRTPRDGPPDSLSTPP